MSSTRQILHIYHWGNGMVMVFDQHGCQMPKYQGIYNEVRNLIIENAPRDAIMYSAIWKNSFDRKKVNRDEW